MYHYDDKKNSIDQRFYMKISGDFLPTQCKIKILVVWVYSQLYSSVFFSLLTDSKICDPKS